jgi:hypothetical protein
MDNNYLYHWGVKGMKWGVRKQPKQVLAAKSRRSKKMRDKYMKSLSDDELKREVNRLNMEKQYRQLTNKEVGKGRKKVAAILATAATTVATTYAIKYMTKGANFMEGKASKKVASILKAAKG